MSLLLTKSCEYALLVTIQEGRYFKNDDYSIKVETELDLRLPSSINDLIPQDTLISSPSVNIQTDGTCAFHVSLVYFISSKQLVRLRKEKATTTLYIKKVYKDSSLAAEIMDKIQLSISEAKEVVSKSAHHLEHIYKFVADKGDWCQITRGGKEQVKVGLFYVAMPDTAANTNSTSRVSTPCIELRSPPPTPKMTNAVLNQSYCSSSNSSSSNNSIISSNNRRKKITSIIGTQLPQPPKKKVIEDKRVKVQPTLRRTKSSLMDLNIEELADMLRKINVFSNTNGEKSEQKKSKLVLQQSYHQIGKGSLKYTFYFKVLQADHIHHTILRSSNHPSKLKRPYVTWSFLSTYNISPAASYSTSTPNQSRSCYPLSGHLVDIQNWLDSQSQIKLNLIMMDKHTKQTAGTGSISLKNLAFTDRTFDDRTCLVHNAQEEEVVAQITVRLGLISGWHQELNHEDRHDAWDRIETRHKKMRHASQSSIPTLISTSTQSTQCPPVHPISPFSPSSFKKMKP
ncbi:hypothetical protein G6F15_002970 [Rhizopus arrhizus]|nr:hypothetical protein G6F15_002970 [Rhizopus arrhizus]